MAAKATLVGPQGPVGAQALVGAQGPVGPEGQKGDRGPQGPGAIAFEFGPTTLTALANSPSRSAATWSTCRPMKAGSGENHPTPLTFSKVKVVITPTS
ncbi:MAG: hypothetical protein JST08_05480 [Actinobacteria bacterium]|nr:hypothetical protein [Actinomycetota bacterium]